MSLMAPAGGNILHVGAGPLWAHRHEKFNSRFGRGCHSAKLSQQWRWHQVPFWGVANGHKEHN